MRSALFMLVLLAACANEAGEVTVISSYTGTCEITVQVGEDDDDHDTVALPAGTQHTTTVEPGLIFIRATAGGTICGGVCSFVGSQTFNTSACSVYAAGADIGGTVRVIDDTMPQDCGNGQLVPRPVLVCD